MSFEIHLSGHVKSVVDATLPGLVADLVASGITAGDPTLWGPAAEDEASQRLGWVEAVSVSRPLVAEIVALRAAARRARASRASCSRAWAARRSPPRSSRRPPACRSSSSTRPRPARCSPRSTATPRPAASRRPCSSCRRSPARPSRPIPPSAPSRPRSATSASTPLERIVVVTDPGSPLDAGGARRRLHRLQRRPDGRRTLLGAHRVRTGAVGSRGRRHRRAPRRGGGDAPRGRDRQPRQPRARARRRDRRQAQPAPRQARPRHRRHPHRGSAGLDRAARRRVDGQGGHRHPARRPAAGLARGRERSPPTCRSCASSTRRRVPLPRAPRGRDPRQRLARRAAHRLGVRDGDRRTDAGHQPVRPARRRVRQDRGPRAAGRASRAHGPGVHGRRASRCASRTPRSRHPEPSPACSTRCGHGCPRTATSSIQAYVNRLELPQLEGLRELVAADSGRPTTFGWGPRFLHSTGQYHKGGPANGVFLQILERTDVDLEIPGRPVHVRPAHRGAGRGRRGVLAEATAARS